MANLAKTQDTTWLASFEEGAGGGSERAPKLRLLGRNGRSVPASVADASGGAVFDGVLFNREELRRRLSGTIGAGATDADLVYQAFRRWGEDALHAVQGIFSVILWDATRDLLLCARDALGVYPLFYAVCGSELLLSTSTEALLGHPRVPRRVSRMALVEYLCHRSPSVEETFLAGVKRVPPGHALRVTRGGHRVFRYWHPVRPDADPEWVGEDALERFNELLGQAVRRCVELGPAGIYLSGGLDSVTVAAIATDITRHRGLPMPAALSLVFPHPDCNEESAQRRVAAALGLRQTVMPFDDAVGPRGLLLEALEMSAGWPAPLQNVWNPAYQCLAREARGRGCDVILTGGGGDEWLTVTPVYVADLLRSGSLVELGRFVLNMQRSYRLPPLPLFRNLLWTNGARLLLGEAYRWALERAGANRLLRQPFGWIEARRRRRRSLMPAWLAPDPELRREMERQSEVGRHMAGRTLGPGGFYFRDLHRALDHPLTTLELEEMFESGRRLGLRVLMPFWDAELVRFLCRVPPRLLNQGGRSKGLVRTMLEQRFPQLDFGTQKKIVSLDFFRSTMLNEGERAWRSMGGVPALAELGIVDAVAVDRVLREILDHRRQSDAFRIWDILNLEAWLRPRL
jgi:asparagine synthetase B (glutamine-hydrolysing)